MTKQYAVNEIFYSPQGEGARAGTMNVFVRLAKCNLTCNGATVDGVFQPICDTEFESFRKMTLPEIIAACREAGGKCCWVILTGGEPLLQVDDEMIGAFHVNGYRIAVETNGTREIPDGMDWVCVSPKVAEHALKAQRADELKYVRQAGQGIPRPKLQATHYFISPAWSPEGLSKPNLDWCLQLVRENPDWRITVQLHKLFGVR